MLGGAEGVQERWYGYSVTENIGCAPYLGYGPPARTSGTGTGAPRLLHVHHTVRTRTVCTVGRTCTLNKKDSKMVGDAMKKKL